MENDVRKYSKNTAAFSFKKRKLSNDKWKVISKEKIRWKCKDVQRCVIEMELRIIICYLFLYLGVLDLAKFYFI